MKPYQLHPAQILRHNALYLAIISALYPSFSAANPSGAQVISGQVSIDQSVSGVTTIKNSPNAIINWQNFNIAKNEITQFIQQNGQSAVLNRIVGGNPSEILGSLYSNGKVFLINPNGIVFGAGSQIDTQGLLASSLNLSDNDFQKGNFHFIAGSKAGDIANEGIIHAGKDGNIVLVAPNIQNSGIIKSEGGKIVLAAGQELILTSMDDPEIRFQVQAPKNHVLNVGQLLTEGGSINVFAGSIKHSGDISADSVEIDKQGNIRLVAKADVTLEKDSTISANNEKGVAGKIEITGENVALFDNSKIEAVGEKGGGEILVGGDYQGKNAAVQNAQNTVVAENVEIKADAKTEGNGGKVIVWSDNETKVAATFSAKGGKKSGDGGLVETSGKKLNIADTTKVSTIAPKGKAGTWLLDPNDFTIANSGGDISATTLSSNLDGGGGGGGGGGDVTIQSTTGATAGNGDIFVNDGVSWSTTNKLTLNAVRNIEINAALNGGTTGKLELNAANSITATAAVNVGEFTLINGAWNQIGTTLPSFSATDFRITGGTFFRALGGGGVAINPNQITDVYGLQGMKGFLSSSFSLANNIDASGTSVWNSGAGFVPIGHGTTASTAFTGTFDGLGHTISNLTINRPATDFVGLFGYSLLATIQDISLTNINITGQNVVGGLLGYNYGGTVSNSYSTGAVLGTTEVGGLLGGNEGTVSNSYSTSAVSGTTEVGGLLGKNNAAALTGTVTNSYSTGGVSGTSSVGGLLGYNNNGTVSNSYSTGAVSGNDDVGGLVGYNDGTVEHSYSSGLVTGNSTGGLVATTGSNGSVSNSFWDINTSGQTGSTGGTGKTTAQMGTESTFTTEGWDFGSTWSLNAGLYPRLQNNLQTTWTLSGTAAGVSTGTIKYSLDSTNVLTTTTNASGVFSTTIPYADVTETTNVLSWLSSNNRANLTNYSNLTDLKLELDTIYGTKNLDTSKLPQTTGGLSGQGVPYTFDGLTLTPAVTTLKANNDVTINHNITTSGAAVSVKAGRSVIVSADKSVTTNGGNINITANADVTHDGIQNVHRDAGNAIINVQTGANPNGFYGGALGGIAILMRRNTDKSYNDATSITLGDVEGNQITIDDLNDGSGYVATTNDNIILNGTLTNGSWVATLRAKTVTNNGTIDIGGANTIGTINVFGDFIQSSDGALNVEIQNAGADGISVSGNASLDGTVNASVISAPSSTATYSFLIATGTQSGSLTLNTTNTALTLPSANQLTYTVAAAFDNYIGASGGNWNSDTNWEDGSVPTSSDDVVIGNYNVVLDAVAFAKSLTISGTGSLSGSNRLTVVNNVTYNANGSVTLPAITANSLTINYGQNAVATNNTATYMTTAPINLPAGQTFTTKLGTDGTPDNYTVINSANALNELQAIGSDLSGKYALGANIDATATSTWNETTAGSGVFQGFAPIGDDTTAFTGIFDGLGHTISNLTINRPSTSYVGLFGNGSSETIKNIGLINTNIRGAAFVGGLIGYNLGTVSNSYSTGAVSGTNYVGGLLGNNVLGTVNNSYSTSTVSGGSFVGGLSGNNAVGSSVSSSYSTGAVSGIGSSVGGLLGYNDGTVSNSYSTGNVTGSEKVGGLVGTISGTNPTITNSYSTGLVSLSNGSTSTYVGGLVGYSLYDHDDIANTADVPTGTITNSYWDADASGQSNSAAGTNGHEGIGLTTAQMTHATNFTGFDFTSGSPVWAIQEVTSYPYLTINPNIVTPTTPVWGGSSCVTGVCFYPTSGNSWNLAANWSDLDIPDSSDDLIIGNYNVVLDVAGFAKSVTINRGSLDITGSLTTTGILGTGAISYNVTDDLELPAITANSLSVNTSGNVTQSAPISASTLLLSGAGNYTLQNTGNVIGTLAANGINELNFLNSSALTIGWVNDSISGITATGTISVATNVGNLTIVSNVTTTNTSSNAIVLNAGSSKLAGDKTGGQIGFSATPPVIQAIDPHSSNTGRVTFKSGEANNSSIAHYISPGNFRYNNVAIADEGAKGTYAIYREQPTLTVTPSVSSMTYGDTSPTLIPSSYSGMKNGDTDAQIFVTTPILTIGGVTSTSGNYAAGNHPISSNAVEQLGYLVNYGSFTVNPQNLAITAIGNNKTYDSTTSATVNLADNRIPGDVFTTSYGSASFSDPNVGTAKPITVSGIGISGTDANNYTFNTTTTTSADITAALLHAISLSGTRVYDGTTTVNAGIFTLSGLKGSDDLTLSGAGTIADKNVGTNKSVSLGTLALGNGSIGLASNYTFAGGTYTVNITPAPLSITATPVIKVYGNVDPQLTYTASGLIGSDSLAGTLTRTAGENIGQYPITIGSLNNPNYTISYTPADFTITAAALALAITADNQTRLYGAVNPTFTGQITNGQLKNGDTLESLGLSFSTTATQTSSVGNYPIIPSITNTNYVFTGNNGTLAITPASLSVTANAVSKKFGEVDPNLTFTSSGLIGNDALVGNLSRDSGENVGNYAITQGNLANPNYNISYTGANFTINPVALNLAIQADSKTRLYGASNPIFTGTITAGALQNGETLDSIGLTFSTDATSTSNVGNYQIIPALSNQNYIFTGTNGVLSVTPANLTVTANAVSKKFGEVDPNLTFTSNGLIGNDALAGNLSRESGENVGNYAISQGSLANSNYNISYTGANFTINPVILNLVVQADSKTRLYGASNPIFTGTIAAGALQNGETLDSIGLTFSTDATSTSNVGNYQIIPVLTNQNYIFTGTNGVLSVTPASLTVTANTLSKIYGETDPALTYSVSGLIGNDALAGNLSRASGENAGNYAITQGSLANPNYNISYTGANFTINPAILNLAIQADSKTRLYGASNPIFTGTITAGALQNGETLDSIGLTFNTDATSTSNVGTYQIIPVLTNQNYIFTSTNGILSVTPASLTVTANTLSKIYGEIDPVLTYSTSGLINSDTLSGNLARASGENVGNYAITQGNLANPNYTLNYVGAELGISPANLTITANPQSKTFGEADPKLTFSIQGLVGEDKLTGELSRVAGETVKTYEITSNVSAGDNYKLSYIPNLLTINRAPKITWISQTDNQWQNAANWNQGVLPDSTQDVSIPNTSFNIDMAGTINVNSLFSLASLHLVDGASVNVTNPFTLQIGTVLSGNGSFITPQFINNGTFSPGNSPGAISIAGDFIQTESGLLKMEIQDETPSGYDQLNISGDATLNGTVKLVSLNGYKPSPNFQPKFLSASHVSGLFNRIDNSESPALNYKFNFVDGQLITALLPDSFNYESTIRNLADDAKQAEFIISEVEKGTESQMNTVITMSPQQTTLVTEEELKKNNNLVSVVEKGSTTFANKSTKTLGVCQ
jgi:filamentous hemagglutinin family protein